MEIINMLQVVMTIIVMNYWMNMLMMAYTIIKNLKILINKEDDKGNDKKIKKLSQMATHNSELDSQIINPIAFPAWQEPCKRWQKPENLLVDKGYKGFLIKNSSQSKGISVW